jgi:serine/threonine protein kinase
MSDSDGDSTEEIPARSPTAECAVRRSSWCVLPSDHEFIRQVGKQHAHLPAVRTIRSLMRIVNRNYEYVREISDFRFDRRVGKGGFGEVWLGNDLRTGRVVAIKELFAEHLSGRRLQCFEREISTMADTASPFVVSLVGFTIEYPFSIITEYMPNGSLHNVANKGQRQFQLSGTHQTVIALCIAHALLELSQHGIVHRDLKSANILLDENRLPRLCDFGTARFVSRRPRRMTQRIGTYTHMAPEIMTGTDYGPEVDVYSYGMILFELYEGRSPFRAYRPATILLEKVPQERIHPEITERGGSDALISLMRRCWSFDPAQRPSWTEIIGLFSSGVVAFPGTNTRAITEFIGSIDRLIAERISFPPRAIVDIDRVMKRLEERLRNAIRTRTSAPDCPITKITHEQSQTGTEHSSSAILANPSHPRFDAVLTHFTHYLVFNQFKSFYWVIIEHFKLPNEALVDKCMRSFTFLVLREPEFIPRFSRVHFFSSLPLGTPLLVARSFQFAIAMFMHYPTFIDQRMARALGAFIVTYPRESAQLFVIYVSKLTTIPDPYPIIDLFLGYARVFADTSAGVAYVQVLYHLVTRVQGFRESRFPLIRKIFVHCMRSHDSETSDAATKAICATWDNEFKLPFDAICRSLARHENSTTVLSILLRLKQYPVSQTLGRALVARSLRDARTFEVLWRFADQSLECARILLRHSKWMQSASIESLRLLLVCFKYSELRPVIAGLSQFWSFLAHIAALGGDQVLSAIAIVLRRCSLDQTRIMSLSRNLFFHKFYESIKQISDKMTLLAANALLDEIARNGFTTDFNFFIPILQRQLAMKNQLTTAAIAVLVTFSCHTQLAAAFRSTQLVQYFQALRKVASLEKQATLFLKNVGSD